MFYSSRYSRKHVFHYADCRYSKRTKEENKISFRSFGEAINAGCVPCAYCNLINRQYEADQKAIDAFCEEFQFKHFLHKGELFIISADDTAWRICSSRDNGKGKILFHESKYGVSYDRRLMPYIDREYHIQRTPITSLMGYLVYIQKHDIFEKERKEKQKLERALRKEEVKSIRAVQKQMARQNRKHKKHAHFETSGQQRKRSKQQLRALAFSFTDYKAASAAYI